MLYPDSYFLGFQGWFNTPVAGTPSLPETHDLFLLPPGASDISVEVLENEAYTHPYKPTPGRTWLSNEVTESYTFDNIPPIDNNLLSQTYTPVRIEYMGKKRNDVLVAVTVSPIYYNPADSNIQVSSTLSYRLKYNLQDIPPLRSRGSIEPGLPKDPITPYPPYPPYPGGILQEMWKWEQALAATNDSTLREADDYLIITTPKYKKSLKIFAAWKKKCGHRVHILYDEEWTPEKIKSSIIETYEHNPYLKNVILAGTIEEIPAENSYENLSDYPYCSFDTSYLSPCEEKDVLRDLYSGRFFASDETEMITIVNKIITYEREGVSDKSFYNRAFHVGFFQDGQPYEHLPIISADGIEDTRMTQTCEEIRNYVLTKNKSVKRLYGVWPYRSNPDYHFIWPHSWKNAINGYGDYQVTRMPDDLQNPKFWFTYDRTHITDAFNEGAVYGLEITHGDSDRWTDPKFTIEDIKNLKNGDKLPIIFSTGCMTGDMTQKESFAKTLLNHQNGGAVAVLAHNLKIYIHYAQGMGIGYINTIWPYPGVNSTLNCHGNNPQYPNMDYSYQSISDEDRLTLGNILEGGILHNWRLFGNSSVDSVDFQRNKDSLNKVAHLSHIFGDPGMLFPTEAVEPIPEDSVSVTYKISPDMFIADKSHKMIINISLPFEAKIGLYNKTTGKIERYYGKRASIYAPSTKHEYVLSVVKANRLPFFLNITESTPKSGANAVLPQLTSASQQPGNASVDITVDFQDCMTEHAEVTISDMYGNNIGNSVVSPDENSCSVKITQPITGIGLVTLSVDGTVIDATKINIVK